MISVSSTGNDCTFVPSRSLVRIFRRGATHYLRNSEDSVMARALSPLFAWRSLRAVNVRQVISDRLAAVAVSHIERHAIFNEVADVMGIGDFTRSVRRQIVEPLLVLPADEIRFSAMLFSELRSYLLRGGNLISKNGYLNASPDGGIVVVIHPASQRMQLRAGIEDGRASGTPRLVG